MSLREKLRVAAVQMVAAPEVEANLASVARLVAEAAASGARLVALPENAAIMGRHERDKLACREPDGDGPIQRTLAEIAARHRVWLVAGTIPLAASSDDKVRAACLVIDDQGRRIARYDKIHLFGFTAGAERYHEAATIEAGDTPVAVDTPLARIGLSVCYDVRFPELYRALGRVDLITVPSAFTVPTGRAHWELLLRARAVENQCYVIAPAQGGKHANGRETWGHTMIVGPWGEVIAQRSAGEGVVIADLDPAELDRVRTSLPALTHRVIGPGL